MRLTLDWDSEAAKDDNLDAVVNRESITGPADYTLKRSAGGEGYHYIEYQAAGTWPEVTALRDKYGDDRKRLQLDLLRQRQGSPFLQVLFKQSTLSGFRKVETYRQPQADEPQSGQHRQPQRRKSPDASTTEPLCRC